MWAACACWTWQRRGAEAGPANSVRPKGNVVPTLRGVTLDLWRTLIQDGPEVGRQRFQHRMASIEALLGEAGVPVTYDQLRQASRACFQACEGIRSQERELSFPDQVDLFLNLVEPGLALRLPRRVVGKVRQVYGSMPAQHTPDVLPDAPAVLRDLRDQGFALALISNTGVTPGKTIRTLLARMELLQYLGVLVFSDEVGMVKPAERMFHLALEQMSLTPQEAVHVGDHPHADVLGATRAGMWTVQVETEREREQVAEPHLRIPSLHQLPEALAQLQRRE